MEISIGSYKLRVEVLILIVIIFWIMFGHMLCSCCKFNLNFREGFSGANYSSAGPEFAGAKTPDWIMNPSTWSMPTLTYSPGTTPDTGVKAIFDRPKQPIPLPKDELDMFATTKFKPECCPNAYSTSTGCACMTVGQYNYLRDRGGNNVPYSEY
uniref:Uncharacterized protein n=1 Tax=viral metagenome TaxID=1070528 RepID=A0A6C0KNE9_9ZZZZ